MPATLNINNFDPPNLKERAQLGADAAIAATSITVDSTQGFDALDYIFIGRLGVSLPEKVRITTVSSATALALGSALTTAHASAEDVVAVYGDQVQLYRAANVDGSVPLDAAFATVGSPVSLDTDDVATSVTDSTGGTGYWYKWTYRNSSTLAETSLRDVSAIRGQHGGAYATVTDIRNEAGFKDNDNVTDELIDRYRRDAQAEVDGNLGGPYAVPFSDPAPELVEAITRLLAAGKLLLKEYGPEAQNTNKDGQLKVDDARKLLQQIQAGTLTVVDGAGNSLATTSPIDGWPDDTTADATPDEAGSRRMFSAGKRY